jgi:hypothetical protein
MDRARTRRAVTSTLSYVITLGIATVLVTGLLIAGGQFVGDQRKEVIRTEMRVVGQQVAADIQRADRLVQAGQATGSPTVELTQQYPQRVTGSSYEIHLVPNGGNSHVALNSTLQSVTVRVNVTNETSLVESRSNGGTVRVVYTASGLEVRDV